MQIEIDANKRTLQGKGASRRLRVEGKVPGVIYGGEGAAQSIELDHNNLFYKLKLEAFHASVLSLKVDGVKEQVLLRDVQMHPYKPQVLHVDFQRVDTDKKIHMKVPLHFVNAELSSGVKLAGGMVSHVLTEVDVSCFPQDLPEYITVDLSEMAAGSTLHLSDLQLPENVEIPALIKGDNLPVATLIVQRGAAEESSTS
ncbi:50S ribosomal protein L25/general stress protein Ctc [Nitrosomonas communis]|uniref:Large ribosomal subunit protein bL25 n=1 Tax=Nitrosomonas communis TaxID=44574 RepID=A0A1H2TTG1_9PROT|nr:50S ribosomal protein L25/general stress protein Ctc [Nitrosomonas communis]SDW47160.1 large subunit ribosomal protein L25 [Nitrosomonas communis]